MSLDTDESLSGLRGDERILMEARLRFRRCKEHQGKADTRFLEDTKFANADARNGWQWPEKIWQERTGNDKPTLTINKTKMHNRVVINDAMQNKSSIKVRPTGGRATYEGAQANQALMRRTEYISKAQIAYRMAITHQVDGGIGYVVLETAFVSPRSHNQDVYIRGVKFPNCVYLDPDIREADGSDAGFGFEFESLSRAKFNRKYPKYKEWVGKSTALGEDEYWVATDKVMIAKYHRRKETPETLVTWIDPQSNAEQNKWVSEITAESGKEICDALLADIENGIIDGRTRKVMNQEVEWFLIAGDCIVDRGPWAGKYIPICRCVGEETTIEGEYDRKGLTRAQIDAQLMLNYNASASIEFGALQTKVPWTAPARALEGQEGWKDANKKNYAVLTWNDLDEEAPEGSQKIDGPVRTQPPTAAPIYQQGMQDAERQLMMVTGQYQSQLGEQDKQSAESGRAIQERQRQGDTATYHFIEHQGDMLRYVGMQLLDLYPRIYDTKQLMHVFGEDGTKLWMQIDPNAPDAYKELKKEGDEAARILFNPTMGEYDCMSDPGPNYATQRQEAWNAISIILQQNMQLASVIGDLLFKFGDFPGADEIMDRLKKEIQATKPYLFDENQEPGMIALQEQLKKLGALNGELVQKLAEMQLKLRGRDEKRDIDAFNAETGRMKAEGDIWGKLGLSPQAQAQIEHEITTQVRQHVFNLIEKANEPSVEMNGAGGQ